MTTVASLIDQISSHLHSFTGLTEPTTFLTAAVDASVTDLPVGHPSRITQGLVEIDDELVHVNAVGSTSFSAMPGFGRGASQSTAAAHAQNARVTNDPQFPRIRIFEAVKRCILQIQPLLFQVKTTTFTFTPVVTTYEIPADVDRILKVQYQEIGSTKEWLNVPAWAIDHNADTTNFPSGKALVFHSFVESGRTVQVTYASAFVTPTSTASDLETFCKIPTSMHDVLLYGTAWSLVQFLEPYRLQLRSVEQQARAQGVDVGGASKVAQQLYAMYEMRKREERDRLLMTHKPGKHFVAR